MQFHAFDRHYLEQLRSGDFRTQEHFVSYFSELIRLKLSKRLHSRSEVEDARQETFARVFAALRKPDGIREPERLGAFVNSVCNNVVLEYYRSSSQEATSDDEEAEANIPDPAVSVVDVIASRQMQSNVREILGQLQEKDRRLIKEIFLDERDKDEVCRDLGVDREYLRVLLHRAKKSFKSIYLKKVAKEVV
ncbi:MAG TPA: sigma-70 family RNA polymerase sigma factor [Candidatus Sulfotelmatobacter sp.]|nr:sigma-70 family RNA polymerase sigma factor [Candidatus Sulfotelmatobacter sp.]